ncbi:MAG TPA: ADP-ribose pyrophosphatase [Ruminococcaceae bacterium]|jgi:ADP-ribose pyrophosphatase|nr:ADP-ribose pyrophosphatase [Oscillospiraceae bacterium]HBQ45868.1 ADP-ribose pyrophosphatase [Oscillospiraceae bacterium]HBT91483.1 ADP-ribose pyrophosphatase [Oscillospiraceae bacterium]HCB91822.1 ADP-ribose pyrophosphatase [Oscillospiraceae bacterium]
MKMTEKTVSQNYIYRGRVLDFHVDRVKLQNGRASTRECVDHCGGVAVAALTDRDELYFVRQYRYPYREPVLELPAGKLEPGEDPLEAGRRELREETGVTGTQYRALGKLYPSPGYTNEVIYLYACRVQSSGESHPDADEFLEAEKIPLEKAVAMVMAGEIPDAKTQVLILKIARRQVAAPTGPPSSAQKN